MVKGANSSTAIDEINLDDTGEDGKELKEAINKAKEPVTEVVEPEVIEKKVDNTEELQTRIKDLDSKISSLTDTISSLKQNQYVPPVVEKPVNFNESDDDLRTKLYDKPNEVLDNRDAKLVAKIKNDLLQEQIKQELQKDWEQVQQDPDFAKYKEKWQPLMGKKLMYSDFMKILKYEDTLKELSELKKGKDKQPHIEDGQTRTSNSRVETITDAQRKIARQFGLTDEDYLREQKALKKQMEI